ncbi:MAG: hypothetical protein ACKOW2_05565 [Sphingobacteriaceae bacterium]
MEYSVTFKNHVRATGTSLLVVLLVLLGLYYLKNISDVNYRNIELNIALICTITLLPVFYLHLEYFLFTRGKKINIDIDNSAICISKSANFLEKYTFKEIKKITIYMPPSWFRTWDKLQYLPFEQYHYARIFTQDGKEIIFTCLLAENVDEALSVIKDIPIERKKRLFASILLR